MSGVATMDGNFTATTAGMYISGSTNANVKFYTNYRRHKNSKLY